MTMTIPDELCETLDDIDLMTEHLYQQRRRRELLAGIPDDDRSRERPDMPAFTARLRAENDELEAQLVRRRQLRVIDGGAS